MSSQIRYNTIHYNFGRTAFPPHVIHSQDELIKIINESLNELITKDIKVRFLIRGATIIVNFTPTVSRGYAFFEKVCELSNDLKLKDYATPDGARESIANHTETIQEYIVQNKPFYSREILGDSSKVPAGFDEVLQTLAFKWLQSPHDYWQAANDCEKLAQCDLAYDIWGTDFM